MDIRIITVFNSHNYGSYLQAKQLAAVLKNYGNVDFLDTQTRNNFKLFIKKAKRVVKTSKSISDVIRGPIFEFKEWRQIKKCWGMLPSSSEMADLDVAVLGSDEIWNITRSECLYPTYWGAEISSFKISYAPSINKASIEDFHNNTNYVSYLNEIDRISVRDEHSKKVLSNLTDKDIELVIDPTLLMEPEHVDSIPTVPYIAVYVFEGSLMSDEKNEIIAFAREKKLKLISAGQYLPWCDASIHSVNGNPFFIFEHAEYVITNTFHGTAYAINYRTQFVSLGKRKPKIVSMLYQFDFGDRLVVNEGDLNKILSNKIDYSLYENKIISLRKSSLKYIEDSFNLYKNQ